MKKKYDLFKAIMICFIIYIALSWIIPTGTLSEGAVTAAKIAPVGLFGIFNYPLITIATFIQFGVVALAIGAFYGVLDKTGVYKKFVENFAKKYENKERLFLIAFIVITMILSSVIGVNYAFFVFVPLFMGVLLKMGYNKITALSATIGSILAGSIASTYGLGNATQISNILGLKNGDNIWLKFAFLAIVIALYVFFVVGNKESKLMPKTKKTTKKIKETIEETKKTTKKVVKPKTETIIEDIVIDAPFMENQEVSSKKQKPLGIMLVLLTVILFLSMINWKYMFKVEIFEVLFKLMQDVKVFEIPIITSVLGVTNPFGYWTSYEMSALLLIMGAVIGWIYNLKFDQIIEGFINGSKKMFKTAFLMTIGCVVFTLMLSGSGSNMFVTITDKLLKLTEGFNFFTTSVVSLLSGFFYNDFYYALNSVSSLFTKGYDAEFLPIIGFIFQSMHSIVMMLVPTSLILIGGLSILGVSIKEWIKYIFKFALQLIALTLVISVVLVLLV
ncbi:MAG: hypothetical protein RRY22_04595 [Bacilli bacterium]